MATVPVLAATSEAMALYRASEDGVTAVPSLVEDACACYFLSFEAGHWRTKLARSNNADCNRLYAAEVRTLLRAIECGHCRR